MYIFKKQSNLPPSVQIFDDYVAEDAAREKRDNDARWRNRILDSIAAIVRSVRK